MRRPRNRHFELGIIMLMSELVSYGLHNIPSGTMGLILMQALGYMGMIPALDPYMIGEQCVLPKKIVGKHELHRLFFSTYMHADDMHLYYNMASFLVKGVLLEPHLGTPYFLYLITAFGLLTNLMVVGVSYGLETILGITGPRFMSQCGVGFSGVIFAIKVLSQEYNLMGRRYARYNRHRGILDLSCWSELLLIQMATPNASFVGHLCGILVGLLYTRGFLDSLLRALYPGSYLGYSNNAGQQRFESRHSESPPRYGWTFEDRPDDSPRFDDDNFYRGMSEDEILRRTLRRSRHEF